MKVVLAICGTKHYFGLPKYFYFLSKHLARQGIEVEVILDSRAGQWNLQEVFEGGPYPRVKIITPTCQEDMWNAPKTAIWSWKVAQYLRHKKFDVLHCGHVTPYFYLRQRNRKPVVFQPFGNEAVIFAEKSKGLRKVLYNFAAGVTKYCGKNADVLLAEGEWQLEEMERIYGRKESLVMLGGVDIDFIEKQAGNNLVTRERLGIGKEVSVTLTVNTFHSYKDYSNLIRALPSLENITAIMVGVGPEKLKCVDLVYDLGVSEKVIFLDDIPEHLLYGLYKIADVYVSPTKVEDFQMGIAEAEVLGLPIVSTGQKFQIDGNGFVVGKGNPRKLAYGIKEALQLKAVLGKKSKEVARRYGFKEAAEEAIRIYEKLEG